LERVLAVLQLKIVQALVQVSVASALGCFEVPLQLVLALA
jgi:hypothetical protein